MIRKESRQLLGDRKLSAVSGRKKLAMIQVSMLPLSDTVLKNLSDFLQLLQQRQNSCGGITQN